MEHLLKEISHVDEYHIEAVLNAALERYAVLYPEWEISTLSLPKDTDRNIHIDRIIQLLNNMKK